MSTDKHNPVGCDRCGHDSDCSLHNEPAYPNGPCDCHRSRRIAVVFQQTNTEDEPPAYEFVEVENGNGASIRFGEWEFDCADGYVRLWLPSGEDHMPRTPVPDWPDPLEHFPSIRKDTT